MAAGNSVNRTYVDITHRCYEIDTVMYTFINTRSTLCVIFYIVLSSISAVTVCGNLLVIISIIYFKQLHTPTNSLILSLAVADLLVGFLGIPLNMQFSAKMCVYYSDVRCQIRESIEVTLSTASVLNLCCISIDRYYAVCQPLTYRTKINTHVAVIMIVVTWVVSVLVAAGVVVSGLNLEKCQKNCFGIVLANIVGLLLSFYVPVIVIVCIYLKIFLVAQRQARSIQNTKTTTTTRKVEGKATRTLAIVLGVFLLCWTPFFLCVASSVLGNASIPPDLFQALFWLAISNSMLDPFIYAFFYSWYRSAFRLILTGKLFQGDCSNTKLL